MLKRKVSCTFKREKNSLDNQERIYPLLPANRVRPRTMATKTRQNCLSHSPKESRPVRCRHPAGAGCRKTPSARQSIARGVWARSAQLAERWPWLSEIQFIASIVVSSLGTAVGSADLRFLRAAASLKTRAKSRRLRKAQSLRHPCGVSQGSAREEPQTSLVNWGQHKADRQAVRGKRIRSDLSPFVDIP
jgi:hypothetical protein